MDVDMDSEEGEREGGEMEIDDGEDAPRLRGVSGGLIGKGARTNRLLAGLKANVRSFTSPLVLYGAFLTRSVRAASSQGD